MKMSAALLRVGTNLLGMHARNARLVADPDKLAEEYRRRLAEMLAELGPRPSWWQPRRRAVYDVRADRLREAHESDFLAMLDKPTLHQQAIMAHSIGWRYPVYDGAAAQMAADDEFHDHPYRGWVTEDRVRLRAKRVQEARRILRALMRNEDFFHIGRVGSREIVDAIAGLLNELEPPCP